MKKNLLFVFLFIISLAGNSQIFQQTAPLGSAGLMELSFAHDNLVFTSVNNKLFRSDDYGQNFVEIVVDDVNVSPRCMAMIDDVIVLGGIDGDRIYRSLDLGLTWTSSWTGSPDILGFPAAIPITVDTLGGSFFMCGTNFIRRSDDLGLTWITMDIDGLCLGVSSTNGQVYAMPGGNLHRTSDLGITWEDVPDEGMFFANASQDVLVSDGRIFSATALSAGQGLYVSDNGGMSYVALGNFNVTHDILKVNSTIYLTHFDGLSKSEDNGVTWSLIDGYGDAVPNSGDMTFDGVDKIWISSSMGLYWYDINTEEIGAAGIPIGDIVEVSLGSNYTFGLNNGNLFRSANMGETWANISDNVTSDDLMITDVYADELDVYVLGSFEFTPFYYYSSDEGNTFIEIVMESGIGTPYQVLSFNPVIITYTLDVYISDDNGENFNVANMLNINGEDVSDSFQGRNIVHNGNSIFVQGEQGMAYSHNTGNTWTLIPDTDILQLAGWEGRLVRNRANTFPFFVTEESIDGGLTWQTIAGMSTQFDGPEFMWMMNDTLYLQNDQSSVLAGQIYYLSEEDLEWQLSETYGAIPAQIISASATADGRIILGTRGSSAWVINPDPVGIIERQNELLKIYPNPATETIRIDGVKGRVKEIIIYNAIGNEMMKLNSIDMPINVSALSNGIYFVNIRTEKELGKLKFLKR